MKKTPMILSLIVVICLILSSCNSIGNTDTSNNSNSDMNYNQGVSSSIDVSDDIPTDIVEPIELYEKYGNNVYFAIEEKDIYYPEIREYEKVSNCFDIPKDAEGFKKTGAYLKFVETYDELLTYIVPSELDSSVFDSNYVVCVKQFFYDGGHKKRLIGYYDLNCDDSKYSIALDYYKSVDQVPHEQEFKSYEYTTYIIVPKNSVEYSEQLQQITVNGRNDIEDEYYVDDDGNTFPISDKKTSHSYITHNACAPLPERTTAWIIEKGSELEKSYGLEYYNKYSKINFRVILYLPNEPKCDFMITEKEIKDGNLYITVEEYSQYTNRYLDNNDVKFYDLYIQDTSELSENFNVYVLVKTVTNSGIDIQAGANINENPNVGSNTNNDNTSSGAQDIIDEASTSIQVEYDTEREAKDSEFPFDNIVIERAGYDIVAAGKYYGDDFNNIKYYGSYYRIIDTYEDFSALTAWGWNVDESLFGDNFILVLYTYKSAYDTYYSHPKYNELNGKGRYRDFGLTESGNLTITEGKSGSDRAVVGEDPICREDYEVTLPIEIQETIYLVIPKSEMPKDIKSNGEIILFQDVIIEL